MNSSVLTASLTGRIRFFYCVAAFRCCVPTHCDFRFWCVHPPLGPACGPEAGSHSRAAPLRGVKEGTSPRAPSRPLLLHLESTVVSPAWCCTVGASRLSCGPEGRAPMEVPDLRASRPDSKIPLPLREPRPQRLATTAPPHPVSADHTEQVACQRSCARSTNGALVASPRPDNELMRWR